jgi:hypothetical protein
MDILEEEMSKVHRDGKTLRFVTTSSPELDINLAYKLGIGQLYEQWLKSPSNFNKGPHAKVIKLYAHILQMSSKARHMHASWESHEGLSAATPAAMIAALQKLPQTKDIVQRIKQNCWM